ncbi:MAG: M48 family metallopeptidase, partial [Myxococcota bacterium]
MTDALAQPSEHPPRPTYPGTLVPVGEQQSQPATLHLEADALVAIAKDGTEHRLPYTNLKLNLGGYERNYIYCSPADGVGPNITTSAPNFLAALDTEGGQAVAEALQAVAGEAKRDTFWKRTAWGCTGFLVIVIVGVVALIPTLLSMAMDAVPVEADMMLGDAAYEGMDLGGPKVTDPRITGPIEEMVERISAEAAVEGFDFKVDVIHTDTVNAFALPGGQMVVLTGLLDEASSPDEVAGVIGHEIAHVTLRHGLRRTAVSAGVAIVVTLLLGDISGWVLLAGEAAAVVANNSYSQTQESDADVEGARMLAAAGL